jgi:polyisoprenoid-binding protein YceI
VTTTSASPEQTQAASDPDSFSIDGARSFVGFAVRFLGFHTVRGAFESVTGTIRQCADARRCGVEVRVDVSTVGTLNALRDRHLRSSHYFDVRRFPQIVFRARTIERRDSGIVVVGPLTIRDMTREIEVVMSRLRPARTSSDGHDDGRIRFRGTFNVDRADFGVRARGMLGIADGAIGRLIECEVDIEAVR